MGDPRVINEKLKRMKTIETELAEAQTMARSNQNASDILNDMINKGLAKLEADGTVTLTQEGIGSKSSQKK